MSEGTVLVVSLQASLENIFMACILLISRLGQMGILNRDVPLSGRLERLVPCH